MRKVRMKTLAAGPDGCLQKGQVYELDDNKAANFVGAGFAEYMDSPPVEPPKGPAPESAMIDEMEEAAVQAAPAPRKKAARKKVNRG